MKCKVMFLLLILISRYASAQEKIGYFTPKKIFTVSVPYKITFQKNYTEGNVSVKDSMITVKLNGDITVASKLVPDKFYEVDVSSLGRGGRSFNFELGFDSDLSGILTSVNARQEPATADIIKGTVGIVSSAIKLLTGATHGLTGNDSVTEKPKIEVVEQTFTIQRTIEIESDGQDKEITISPVLHAGLKIEPASIPEVVVSIKRGPAADIVKTKATTNTEGLLFIKYMIPAEYILTAIVKNDQFIASRTVINEHVYIPQAGTLSTLNVLVLKGKRQLELAISPTTGALTKYSYIKESTLKAALENSTAGIDGLGAEIKALKAASLTEKEEERIAEEEKFNQEKEARENALSKEVERLRLENERLDLLIKLRELEEQSKKE